LDYQEVISIIEMLERSRSKKLNLSGLGIDTLPKEIGKLTNLEKLDLSCNNLSELPSSIVNLTNLWELSLNENQFTEFPNEIEKLKRIGNFSISCNKIQNIPKGLWSLTSLLKLDLHNNRIIHISELIKNLSNIKVLDIGGNPLEYFPVEIWNLIELRALFLSNMQLRQLSPEIGKLANLEILNASQNHLTELPPTIWSLEKLVRLFLSNNHLKSIPPEIGKLTDLIELDVRENEILELPIEIKKLAKLERLSLSGLISIPPEIAIRGAKAIVAWLREASSGEREQWRSKLIVVGEGGVGKTSLLRSLKGESFDFYEKSTKGIDIGELVLNHPEEPDVKMTLNCWDFGGQVILHATHQFFLTERSLYILVWSARIGWEQSKIPYWLDNIRARAKKATVILVATWSDVWEPKLPLNELRREYPELEIVANISVCNKQENRGQQRFGIKDVVEKIREEAANLPLMGEKWPLSIHNTYAMIRKDKRLWCSRDDLFKIMVKSEVNIENYERVARYLHDLGEILYYPEDEELKDIIILKPQWVSERICRVLECKQVIEHNGILKRTDTTDLWKDLNPVLHSIFIKLMEKYDLSYKIDSTDDISLVVERLGEDEPNYFKIWDEFSDKFEIKMRYRIQSTIPAGIPTWFIARQHRFTQNLHWKWGVLFGDQKENPQNIALVRVSSHQRYIDLTAKGRSPHFFFSIMRDGLELTLNRFGGLPMRKMIPCTCQNAIGKHCDFEFDLDDLETRLARNKPEAECQKTLANIPLTELIFGIHNNCNNNNNDGIMREIEKIAFSQNLILSEQKELLAFAQMQFLRLFNSIQKSEECQVPRLFTLRKADKRGIGEKLNRIFQIKLEMHLWCQEPGEWHPTVDGGRYQFYIDKEWAKPIERMLKHSIEIIKIATPLACSYLKMSDRDLSELIKNDVQFMQEIIKLINLDSTITEVPIGSQELYSLDNQGSYLNETIGSDLRVLQKMLTTLDKINHWGGLEKVLTPEGNYLWLCKKHIKTY